MKPTVECKNLSKEFRCGESVERVLRGINLSFVPGEACLLLGPSGAGKTTLLSILGFLLSPTSGEVLLHGQPVDFMSREKLIILRRKHIGFVFQHSNLLPFLTMGENLTIVARNGGLSQFQAHQRVEAVADRMGLRPFLQKPAGELSGGQRQRTAIARALMNHPTVILADEPTAALDWSKAETAMVLLIEQARADAALLLVVSHDPRLIPYFQRTLRLENGALL